MDQVVKKLALPISATDLAQRVEGSSTPGVAIVKIDVTYSDAEMAAKIANTTGEVLTDVVVNNLDSPKKGLVVRMEPVQTAVAADSPASPSHPLNLLLGLLAGFAFGTIYAFLRETPDAKVKPES